MNIDEVLRRMKSRQLYCGDCQELIDDQLACLDKVFEYNTLKPSERDKKRRLLKDLFGGIGEDCYIETPFYSSWAGRNVYFGDRVYTNFNLVLIDDCEIHVGDDVMIGPNVTLVTGTHPVEPERRRKRAQYNVPIYIEDNVWIGANCVILPGVTVGKNSVIGAGSVVTKDIPPDVVAVGNPCRVLREISERDRRYYYKDLEMDKE